MTVLLDQENLFIQNESNFVFLNIQTKKETRDKSLASFSACWVAPTCFRHYIKIFFYVNTFCV